jgi:hypothetical protein
LAYLFRNTHAIAKQNRPGDNWIPKNLFLK